MVDNLTSIWPAWAAVCSAQQAGSADWWVAANDETVSCSARKKYMERDELEGRRQTGGEEGNRQELCWRLKDLDSL